MTRPHEYYFLYEATPEQLRELEVMDPYARAAFEAAMGDISTAPWESASAPIRLRWCGVANAVLTAYDQQWPNEKAGL